MDVVHEYPDILQNIESSIVQVFREKPELRDPEVIAAMEKLITWYTRIKRGLPELPVVLPVRSLSVFQAMKIICEWRREDGALAPEPDDIILRVPLRIVILCLERLLDSARKWHKLNGQRGYLNYISQFIPDSNNG